jgi:hypothetical protein
MTIQQLEQRVVELEQQLQELRQQVGPLVANGRWRDTFGMFADDTEFDEVLKLGREYRQQCNESDFGKIPNLRTEDWLGS